MGYDNYGMLLNSSDSNKSKLLDSTVSSQYHRHHHNQHQHHSNRRDYSTVSAEYERHRKQKLREKMTTLDDQNQLQQQKQPQMIDPELIRAKNEEENRMVNDTFKAQTIKSLTFKSVVTY